METVAHCLMFDPQTKRKLFDIPCASLSIARDIAKCQKETLNLVHSADIHEAYTDGKLTFETTSPEEFQIFREKLLCKSNQQHAKASSRSSASTRKAGAAKPTPASCSPEDSLAQLGAS